MRTVVVVGDQIVKTKTIVAVDEVYTLTWTVLSQRIVVEKIAAAVQTRHQVRHRGRISLDEAAHAVAKLAVPLAPGQAGKTASQLVGGRIPCLGDKTQSGQARIAADFRNHRRIE